MHKVWRDQRRREIVRDMNARVGDTELEDVVDKFEVLAMNESGRKLTEFCAEKKLSVGNKYFEKKSTNVHGRVNGMVVKAYWISFWCRRRTGVIFLDVNVFRGAGGGISDHLLVLAKE